MDRYFFRFVTIQACDRQTDRSLIAIPHLHYMQRGINTVVANGQTDDFYHIIHSVYANFAIQASGTNSNSGYIISSL